MRTLGEVFNLFDDRPADVKAAAAARLNGDGDRPVNTIRPSEIDSLAAKWDPDNPKRFVNGLASVLWESDEPLVPDLPAGSRLFRQGDLAGSLTEPGAAIFRGPIGDWLDRIADETEATEAALGAAALAGLGAWLGRGTSLRVGRLRHRPNLFVVVVGPSSTARKGTAQREAWKLFEAVDEGFAARNVTSGFGSGQALIDRIADPAKDQRLLIDEQEFAEVLKTADWQNSILGDVLRKAFDSDKPLENQVRHRDSVKSSGHCVSMVGGITPQELSARFTELAASGGFGNRILWVWSDSTKLLPDGGVDYTLDDIAQRISKPRRDYDRTDAAVDWWHAHYRQLRNLPHVPEAARQVVRRAPDQTQRIALIYAATEGADAVDVPHMEAGLAWVNYSIETVQVVLGGLVRSRIASKVLASLRNHPGTAVTRTELHDRALRRNYSGPELDAALSELEDAGLAYQWVGAGSETGGRKPTFVIATTPEEP